MHKLCIKANRVARRSNNNIYKYTCMCVCDLREYAYWNASSSKSVRARILLLRVYYVHSTTSSTLASMHTTGVATHTYAYA